MITYSLYSFHLLHSIIALESNTRFISECPLETIKPHGIAHAQRHSQGEVDP